MWIDTVALSVGRRFVAGLRDHPAEHAERAPCLVVMDRRDDTRRPDCRDDRKIVVRAKKHIVPTVPLGRNRHLRRREQIALGEYRGHDLCDQTGNGLDRVIGDQFADSAAKILELHSIHLARMRSGYRWEHYRGVRTVSVCYYSKRFVNISMFFQF